MRTLFSYGTLRLGEKNAHIIKPHGNYKETVKTVEKYIMITDNFRTFPSLISSNTWPEMSHKAVEIVGDAYDITELGIRCTDVLAGHPQFHIRTTISVKNDAGHIYTVETYILDDLTLLNTSNIVFLNGDWKALNYA